MGQLALKEAKLIAALFAGLVVMTVLDIFYFATMGGFILFTGIPTPGGAPLEIHVANMAIKGAWAALAYGAVMRLAFGRVNWGRVGLLWALGVLTVAVLGGLAMSGKLAVGLAGLVGLGLYLLVGQAVARDWVAR